MIQRLKLNSLEAAKKTGKWFRLLGVTDIWYCADDNETFKRIDNRTAETSRQLISIGCNGLFVLENDCVEPTEIELLYGSWRMRCSEDAERDSSRAFTVFRFHDIHRVEQLLEYQEKDLLKFKNFGAQALDFTRRLLASRDLALKSPGMLEVISHWRLRYDANV